MVAKLSIYSTETPELRYVEEKAGRLQTGFRLVREGIQPYVTAVQNNNVFEYRTLAPQSKREPPPYTSLDTVSFPKRSLRFWTGRKFLGGPSSLTFDLSVISDTYHFLRDPPPGFLPRVSIITVSGLAGVVLARRGSRFKRIAVPVVMTTIGTAVCYPMQTVGVLKVTGKKVYSVSSLVASVFKSTPKVEAVVPDVNLEPVKVPEKVPSMPEGESEAASPATDAGVKETALASKDSLPTDVLPAAQAEVLPVTFPENVIPSEVAPQEDTPPPADEITACPPVKEKPQFVPDPTLLDHGQADPEDADLYTTRG
ncbi:MICOS complex subunit MIC27 [Bagarius yarrelli]|uniref:MICOS complex subunit n=1 Tax=Bagarius yarrelli TaxID=175774 RepID=A0A556V1N4_BAGYA|nr:MICOS complex subunit MIC27 [Bagarius yarrelli]